MMQVPPGLRWWETNRYTIERELENRVCLAGGGSREARGKEKKEGVRGEGREAVVTFSEWGRTERGVGGNDWRGGRRSLKGEDWE